MSELEVKSENINNVKVLYPEGFGYGNRNGISYKNRSDIGNNTLSAALDFLINDTTAFVEAEEGDGCGDGRIALLQFLERNPRAKMFGGGLMMMVALQMAQGNVSQTALEQVNQALDKLIKASDGTGFQFGGHDAEKCGEKDCGCGAIDKFIEILHSIVLYEGENREIIRDMFGDDFDEDVFDKVIGNFKLAEKSEPYSAGYSGKEVGKSLKDNGVDVRTLKGEHKEIMVVINDIEGTTLNQQKFLAATEDAGQAFTVDLWRIRQYASKFSKSKEQETEAMYGMLIYTLGTSATLTDGSQRVFIRN